jgi:hypothetical protein
MAFIGGDNLVMGEVRNGGLIDYDGRPAPTQQYFVDGLITVSGKDTSVTFEDDFQNRGTLKIGPDDNVVSVLGFFDNSSGTIDITADSFGESAYLNIASFATIFGGSLSFAYSDSLSLTDGFSVEILSAAGGLNVLGGFASTSLPVLSAGLRWDVIYDTLAREVRLEVNSTSLAIPGDSNGDGFVNIADYTIWRDTLGSMTDLRADYNGNGVVDQDDYTQWVANYGRIASTAIGTAIPEPTATVLLALGLAGCRRRR